MTDDGNWEGRTILRRVLPAGDDGRRGRGSPASRAQLLERRAGRPQPARDDKALAAWNGLAIGALRRRRARRSREAAVRRGGGRGGRPDPRRSPPAGRPARSLLEGRPIDGRGRPRGLRRPRRRPPRALRGDVRRALVRRRPRARRRDPGALRRPGRRVLRHGRRPRDARHPAEGPPGQRDAGGRLDGHGRPAATRGADRRGPLSRGGGRRACVRGAVPRPVSDGIRELAVGGPSGGRGHRRAGRRRRPGRSGDRVRSSRQVGPPRSHPERISSSPSPPSPAPRPSRCSPAGRGSTAARRRTCCRNFACRLPVTDPDALRAELADSTAPPAFGAAPRRHDPMATFVLIPGAGGDPWEWHRLAPELEALGHEVVRSGCRGRRRRRLVRVRGRRGRGDRRPSRRGPRRPVAGGVQRSARRRSGGRSTCWCS